MQSETLHLLGKVNGGLVDRANFPLSASCNRVAVVDGHTESVSIEFEEDITVDDIEKHYLNLEDYLQEKKSIFCT